MHRPPAADPVLAAARARIAELEARIDAMYAAVVRTADATNTAADHINADMFALRADVERLTTERDEALAGWKATALELDGYEGGVPTRGSRIWRCEHELTKARATVAALEAQRDELRAGLLSAASLIDERMRTRPGLYAPIEDLRLLRQIHGEARALLARTAPKETT